MRYPMIFEMNPSLTREGPSVYLPAGMWEFEHNSLGCKFEIVSSNSYPEETFKPKESVEGDRTYFVRILDPGSDKTLTVYAKKCQSL